MFSKGLKSLPMQSQISLTSTRALLRWDKMTPGHFLLPRATPPPVSIAHTYEHRTYLPIPSVLQQLVPGSQRRSNKIQMTPLGIHSSTRRWDIWTPLPQAEIRVPSYFSFTFWAYMPRPHVPSSLSIPNFALLMKRMWLSTFMRFLDFTGTHALENGFNMELSPPEAKSSHVTLLPYWLATSSRWR